MNKKFAFLSLLAACVLAVSSFASAQEKITLVGGTMLPEGHVYWRTAVKFADLVKEYYKGDADLQIDLHHSGTLGTEKDAVEYMLQGTAIDFYVISPAWIATWEKRATILDAPFMFRDLAHWNKTLESDVFKPIEDAMLAKGIRFLGYGGGGVRALISAKEAKTLEDFPNIRMRIQGSPLHQAAFSATGLVATPMDYMEVYNAIKTGVIDALENEPSSIDAMKFYEVAPYYVRTDHQITIRVIGMSEAKFQSLPADLQEAVLRAGKDAAAYHRETEVSEGEDIIKSFSDRGLMTVVPFDSTKMRELAMPAVRDYADEMGAGDILKAVEAIQ
jgi:TRAP-type C4-dicarboxylate transport system substrate-binding protein